MFDENMYTWLGFKAIQLIVGNLYLVCTFLLMVIAPSGACMKPGAGGGGTGPLVGFAGGGGGQGGGGGAAGAGGGGHGGIESVFEFSGLVVTFVRSPVSSSETKICNQIFLFKII